MAELFLKKVHVLIKLFGESLFLFGLLGWINGEIVQFTHPEWLRLPISHLFLWIRTDTFTILSFIISAIGFFVWRLAKELTSQNQNSK